MCLFRDAPERAYENMTQRKRGNAPDRARRSVGRGPVSKVA